MERVSRFGVELQNEILRNADAVRLDLGTARLVESVLERREGCLTKEGALAVQSDKHARLFPPVRFLVKDGTGNASASWDPRSVAPSWFSELGARIADHLRGRELFAERGHLHSGSGPGLRISVVSELACHSLLAAHLLDEDDGDSPADFAIVIASGFRWSPLFGTSRPAPVIALDVERRTLLLAGPVCGASLRQALSLLVEATAPSTDSLVLEGSASSGSERDLALFLGHPGAGKTTLAVDAGRQLSADGTIVWNAGGVFGPLRGCYARCAGLRAETEPQILGAVRFGSVLEDVGIDETTRRPLFDQEMLSRHATLSFPLSRAGGSVTGHPEHLFLLVCDAYGVLPPIARLTPEQAVRWFLSGVDARPVRSGHALAWEPRLAFSPCCRSRNPLMDPQHSAEVMAHRLWQHASRCWLLNTGWWGGPCGVGRPIGVPTTRALIRAAIRGELRSASFRKELAFGLQIPAACPGVEDRLIDPRASWTDSAAYDRSAAEVATRIERNFEDMQTGAPDASPLRAVV